VKRHFALLLILLPGFTGWVHGQEAAPLKLLQKIPMPNVRGRLDHSTVDLKKKRLFVAALGDNQNTVEVVDLKSGKRVASIPGQSKPQGVFYSAEFKRLFVANGTDGTCKIFRGDNFKLVDSLQLGANADHAGYDPASKYLYVGIGDAKGGALAIVDTRTNKHVADIKTDARPGGIKFEKAKGQIFTTLEQVSTLPTGVVGNVALALDEGHHRLFDGVREPATLIVLDTESGREVSRLDGVAGIDDLWYDAAHERIYASGGRGSEVGFVYVYQQKDSDHYELVAKIPTAASAGTSLWVPELNRLYVAAPASEKEDAEILVFEPQS
jgi:hypothetical protein